MKLGLDISSIGYFVLIDNNNIVDICKVPQKTNYFKNEIKEITKQIECLKPDLKTRGQKKKTEDKIKQLERKIVSLKDNSPFDVEKCFEWLKMYKKDIEICNIEKPIYQTQNPTSIQSICKMAEYMGICCILLDVLEIPYNIISIQDWRSNFDYKDLPESFINEYKEKHSHKKTTITRGVVSREWKKQESIRLAIEHIHNIRDWYILPRCSNINDNICESALLGLI